ncbi:hypothetical protein [Mucilaginibacter dorajii]|uniref:HMA domain-containing protein n=1 Tax=Mucilaginibacter dorajii TaxID=692994 RepID=A0ABP7Q9R6_9SPHI|nr:hypothetical protein [Mucilaginibacter dorajii]MCS3737078.1 hypothetical protein [Mucilaginibacter dorajii]
MESKIFSYKVEGITLEPSTDTLKVSAVFDRKELTEKLKELFKADGFKVDERSINYKIIDDQLYIQGLAVKEEVAKSIGFMTGK